MVRGWGNPGVAPRTRARSNGVDCFCSPIEKDATLNALAVEAFNDLLKKHGKRQSKETPLLKENDVSEAAPMVAASAVANGPFTGRRGLSPSGIRPRISRGPPAGAKKKAVWALRRTAFSCDCRPGTAPVPPHLCLMLMQLG
jgi:hypothetical protein